MKVTIDLNRLKNSDGNYSETDVKVLEKATGKQFAEIVANASDEKKQKFTAEEIRNMTDEQYEKNRSEILEML